MIEYEEDTIRRTDMAAYASIESHKDETKVAKAKRSDIKTAGRASRL